MKFEPNGANGWPYKAVDNALLRGRVKFTKRNDNGRAAEADGFQRRVDQRHPASRIAAIRLPEELGLLLRGHVLEVLEAQVRVRLV